MKSTPVLLGLIVVTGLISGCTATPRHNELIGTSTKSLLFCMGAPHRQTSHKGSEYLTYTRKKKKGVGNQLYVIMDTVQCDVTFVVREGKVIGANAFGNKRLCAKLTAGCFP